MCCIVPFNVCIFAIQSTIDKQMKKSNQPIKSKVMENLKGIKNCNDKVNLPMRFQIGFDLIIHGLTIATFLALITFSITSASPGAVEKTEDLPKIAQQIQDHVTYPEFARKQNFEGSSDVTFLVKNDSSLSVLNVRGDNKEVNNYIKDIIESFKVKAENKIIGRVYRVKFSFRLY